MTSKTKETAAWLQLHYAPERRVGVRRLRMPRGASERVTRRISDATVI
jgi:hypothetical protein